MERRTYLLLFIVIIQSKCIFGSSVAEARDDLIPGSRYTSARGASMGDAFLPLGDDVPSGLFYNPAVLGKIRKAEFEAINFSTYVNKGFTNMAGSGSASATSLSSYSSTLQKNLGQLSGLGGSIIPSFGFPGLGIGVLAQTQLAAQANADGTIQYRSLYQIIPTLGTGFRLLDGVIRFGYSLQWVNEAIGTPSTSASSANLGFSQGLQQGSGFSHNFGFALTLPTAYLPALNIVVRNAFSTHYSTSSLTGFSSSAGVPADDPMTVDSSISIQPRLGRGVYMNLVFEGRDLTNQSNAQWLGHMAAGAEFVFARALFLRGGFGGGYPSAGLGIRSKSTEISFAYYTEEIGTQYLARGDTRFMLQYQLRLF